MRTMIPFTKMVGAGNDFIIVDARSRRLASLKGRWRTLGRELCDRRGGIGADGLLVLEPSKAADVLMRVLNPDGSEAEMCGNGARCVALYLGRPQTTDHRRQTGTVRIETKAGVLSARVWGDRVALQMTDPTGLRLDVRVPVDGRRVRLGCVNTGVPHVVMPVSQLGRVDVERLGRRLRHHPQFAPRGTNVNFIQPAGTHRLRVRTYERGVEAETLACGTGITASAIVSALSRTQGSRRIGGNRTAYHVDVEARSGDSLTVSFDATRNGAGWRVRRVVLEGPARRICEGTVQWPHHLSPRLTRPRRGRGAALRAARQVVGWPLKGTR